LITNVSIFHLAKVQREGAQQEVKAFEAKVKHLETELQDVEYKLKEKEN
jgi:hypothetical protein